METSNNSLAAFEQLNDIATAQITANAKAIVVAIKGIVRAIPMENRAAIWNAIENVGGKMITDGFTAYAKGESQEEIIASVLSVIKSSPFLAKVLGAARDEFAS